MQKSQNSKRGLAHQWKKLRTASWDELRVRSVQAANKRIDLARSVLGAVPDEPRPIHSSGKFFFSDPSETVAAIRERLPEQVEHILERAERICGGHYDLLGYGELDFGRPVNWHLDPVSGKQSPPLPWYRINFLDYGAVGDAKIIWELNRHQHLVALAKAYRFTGDIRFVAELNSQFEAWQQQNPYPWGINWASSLEVAFRALSWIWIYQLLRTSENLPANLLFRLHAGVCLSARHIERYLSTYFSPNTHLLGEAVALFFAGTLCDACDSERWKNRGRRIVLQEAQHQVQADGFHFEQSTYYHVYALDFFLHFWLLARANGDQLPDDFLGTVRRMADALCTLSSGMIPPRFGDDDGGRLFDGSRNRAEHLTDPLSTATVLFKSGSYKNAQPTLVEETLWLCGPQAITVFDAVAPATDPRQHVALPSSGLCIMRDTVPQVVRMVVDVGAQGSCGGGHSHADALSVQVAVNGVDVLGDPGTFVYVGAAGERQLFRGTAVHNTLQVATLDQMEPRGPFSWQSVADVRVVHDISAHGRFALLAAEHNGFERCIPGAFHRRNIFHSAGEFWFIQDVVGGQSRRQIKTNWVLAPPFVWECDGQVALARCTDLTIMLLFASGADTNIMLRSLPYSLVYGECSSASALATCIETTLPSESAVLLRISPGTVRPAGELRRNGSNQSECAAYSFIDNDASHRIFSRTGNRTWQYGQIESDAAFVCCTVSSGTGRPKVRLLMFSATYLRMGVADLFRSPAVVEFWRVETYAGSEEVVCDDSALLCCTPAQLESRLMEYFAADVAATF